MKTITASILLTVACAATVACREDYDRDLDSRTGRLPPSDTTPMGDRDRVTYDDTTRTPTVGERERVPVPPPRTETETKTDDTSSVDWTSYQGNVRFTVGSAGFKKGDSEDRPLFILYTQPGCTVCEEMGAVAFKDPKLTDLLNSRFVPVLVDVRSTSSDDEDWVKDHGAVSTPRIVFADEDGKLISSLDGAQTTDAIIQAANEALARLDENNELKK